MCTTYLGARLAARLDADRVGLLRLAPAVDRKTRGNAAVAVETRASPQRARRVAAALVEELAADDPNTSPGVAVTARDGDELPEQVPAFTRRAVRAVVSPADAAAAARRGDCWTVGWDGDRRVETRPDEPWGVTDGADDEVVGRGRIGAVAAIGAFRTFDDPTYERLVYRPRDRWGTDRTVDEASVFAAADRAYPAAWDTVDRTAGEAVCVPHTPGPVLFGIRGEDRATVERVAAAIDHEPAERCQTFVTNQGTDAHLAAGEIGSLTDGRAYRVSGVVVEAPETREGGHVFCELAHPDGVASPAEPLEPGDGVPAKSSDGVPTKSSDGVPAKSGDGVPAPSIEPETPSLSCVAFEPTKRFRDHVRRLRVGDRVTVCGELSDGTCKLEKIAVRGVVRWDRTNPPCDACGRSMASAGRGQGFRCRDCDTRASEPAWERLDRTLDRGWYEVPPRARRHVAKPLVRGGFDAPTHPER